jgi:dCMP deaminase
VRLGTDDYYLQILEAAASRTTCPRRSVGCVLVDEHGRAIGMGYNGVPRGMPHCIDEPCEGRDDPKGDSSRCLAVHAEVNAILNCSTFLDRVVTVYVSVAPCFACAKMLANLPNLKRIVCREEYVDRGADLVRQRGILIDVRAVARKITVAMVMEVRMMTNRTATACLDALKAENGDAARAIARLRA